MRKDLLQKLVNENANPRSQLVSSFLQFKKSLESDNADISFSDFRDYLKENFLFFDLKPEQADFLKDKKDSELFSLFIKTLSQPLDKKDEKDNGKKSKLLNANSVLGKVFDTQKAVMRSVLAPQLDVQSVVALSSSHSALYAETQDKSYWVNKLIIAGCNKELLDKVLHANVIQNYKNLYHAFTQIKYRFRIKINMPWELFCLSGDPRAIAYAMEHEKITADTSNQWGESPLHLAAYSGSPSAMAKALELKDAKGQSIDPLAKTATQDTVLHYAALSGSPSAMDKALILKDAKGQSIDPLAKTASQETILHLAALSGSPSAMAKALELKDAKGQSIDIFAKTASQQTVLHLAALSGSPSAMAKALELKDAKGQSIDVLAKTASQETVLHYAAYIGSPSAMDKALTLKDAKGQSIDPLAKTASQETVLHYAAYSGSPSAMDKALTLKDAKGQSIDPLAKTARQETVLHFAAYSGSPSAMDKALTLKDAKGESIAPLAKTASQQTVLHIAAYSGSPSAVMNLRVLSQEFCLGFDATTPDASGHDAFWYADQSKNGAAVKAVLLAPIETLKAGQTRKKDENASTSAVKKVENTKHPQPTPPKPGKSSSNCVIM